MTRGGAQDTTRAGQGTPEAHERAVRPTASSARVPAQPVAKPPPAGGPAEAGPSDHGPALRDDQSIALGTPHPTAPEGARPGRRRRRVLRWTAVTLAVLILGTAGTGYLYYRHLNGNIQKRALDLGDVVVAEPTPNAAGQTPLNILVIGSDARDTEENRELGGARETFGSAPLADVQMLVHLSADRTNMSVVSMPRDTLVHIPRCTDPEDGTVYPAGDSRTMANQSLGHGGPGCTVATWQRLTGIRVDHFVMVDFAGVVSMADAVGGVPVCVDAPILSRDARGHGSGLKLDEGTHDIQGEQALQWLRTRYGFEDGSDLARAKAQHMYMSAMIRRLRENATLSNPDKLRRLAEEATRALTVDPDLGSVKKLYDLSTELRRVEPERITMTTMPNRYVGHRVEPTEEAEQLFRLIREDVPLDGAGRETAPPASPASAPETDAEAPSTAPDPDDAERSAADEDIAVLVRDGTGTADPGAGDGRADAITKALADRGFRRAVADPTGAEEEPWTVVHHPSAEERADALRVAEVLGIPSNAVRSSPEVSGITLTVGADWREDTVYPKAEGGGAAPDSVEALNGADTDACMRVDPAFSWS
ncbi:LCP family protein [Streptomyces sp. WMMC905]|uniref:LCP family protein n=1 Tax=Streptomyces sp. WMMC905 TaxID=3404123 RepID=UPI003B931718